MAKKELTYEEMLAAAEEILTRIQREEVSVDDLAREVKRATELITACKARLNNSEAQINQLFEA